MYTSADILIKILESLNYIKYILIKVKNWDFLNSLNTVCIFLSYNRGKKKKKI